MPAVWEVPVPVADGVVLVVAALVCGMVVSTRLTKRLGLAATLLGLVALVIGRSPLLVLLEIGIALLWLLGRGVPGRRPRPLWMVVLALATGVLAIAAAVTTVD